MFFYFSVKKKIDDFRTKSECTQKLTNFLTDMGLVRQCWLIIFFPLSMVRLASCVWQQNHFSTFLKQESEAQGGYTCRRRKRSDASTPVLF